MGRSPTGSNLTESGHIEDEPATAGSSRREGNSMNNSVRVIVLLLGFTLVVAACGDDDTTATQATAPPATEAPASTEAPTTTTTTTTEPAGGINITLATHEISPVSLTVTSGEPVVLNVENLSSLNHNWALLTAGTQWASKDDFDSEQILVTTSDLLFQGTETLRFTAPAPGTYQVVCTFGRHIDLGMVAELVVEA